jgi:hypothetical protein
MLQDQLIAILIAGRIALIYPAAMARRGWGDDGIYWVESRKRYAGAISLAWGPDGKGAESCLRPDQAGSQGQAQGSARGRCGGSQDLPRLYGGPLCRHL